MLKLQDFSRQTGVSDRQVQRLLKKYESELQGLFERKGPNGTWLSDEACDFLRGKMKKAPVAIFEEDPRLAKQQARIEELEEMLREKEKLLHLAQTNVSQLQEKAGRVELLEGEKKNLEANVANAVREKELSERELKLKDKELKVAQDSLGLILEAPFWKRQKILKGLKKKNKE